MLPFLQKENNQQGRLIVPVDRRRWQHRDSPDKLPIHQADREASS